MKTEKFHQLVRETNTAIRKMASQAAVYNECGQSELASQLYHSAGDMANDTLCELPDFMRHYDAGLSITASVMYARAGNHHGAYEHASRGVLRDLCPKWAVPILRKLLTTASGHIGPPRKHSSSTEPHKPMHTPTRLSGHATQKR